MKNLPLFIITATVACFLQVSIIALPIGIIVVLVWFMWNKTEHLVLLATVFSLILGIVSDLPIFLILLSTTASIAVFAILKSTLPSRLLVNVFLLAVAAVYWEALLVASLHLASL
jgi:hypothetical protein